MIQESFNEEQREQQQQPLIRSHFAPLYILLE